MMNDIKIIAEAQRRALMRPGDKAMEDAVRLLRYSQSIGIDPGHTVAAMCVCIGTVLTDHIRNGLNEQLAVDNVMRAIEGFIERETRQ